MPRIEFFKGDDGKIYFRVLASEGDELVRSTDGYERREGARGGLDALRGVMIDPAVEIVDLTDGPDPE